MSVANQGTFPSLYSDSVIYSWPKRQPAFHFATSIFFSFQLAANCCCVQLPWAFRFASISLSISSLPFFLSPAINWHWSTPLPHAGNNRTSGYFSPLRCLWPVAIKLWTSSLEICRAGHAWGHYSPVSTWPNMHPKDSMSLSSMLISPYLSFLFFFTETVFVYLKFWTHKTIASLQIFLAYEDLTSWWSVHSVGRYISQSFEIARKSM